MEKTQTHQAGLRIIFIFAYVLVLLVPLFLAQTYQAVADVYEAVKESEDKSALLDPISAGLGILALSIFALQILLASRLFGLDKKLGLPFYLSAHGIFALLLIAVLFAHRFIKLYVLQIEETNQNILGSIAFFGLLAMSVLTLLFMHPGLLGRLGFIKTMRSKLSKGPKLTYPKFRLFHILLIGFCLLACVHVALASSSQVYDEGGALIGFKPHAYLLGGLTLVSLLLYIRYRIRGRKA